MRHALVLLVCGLAACLDSTARPGAVDATTRADIDASGDGALDVDLSTDASVDDATACVCDAPPQTFTRRLYLATSLDPSKPIIFRASFTIVDEWQINVDVQALADGVGVGEHTQASGAIREDGQVSIRLNPLVVPAEADPLVPSELTLDLTLRGCVSASMGAMCGEALGAITRPAVQGLAGSTWGLGEGDAVPGACACE